MTTKKLRELRKKVYNRSYGYDGTVEVPEDFIRIFELYDTFKAIEEFYETPLRWYPSGQKVYSVGFRLKVFFKIMGCRLKYLYWRYLKK